MLLVSRQDWQMYIFNTNCLSLNKKFLFHFRYFVFFFFVKYRMDSDRSKLPWRETSDSFLISDGKILALDKGKYIMYPGGGVDEGETPCQAVRREIKEETGCCVVDLKNVATIDSLWWPQWTENKPKREARYKQFKGERTHLFVGYIKSFGNPTSQEGDAWSLPIKKHLISPEKLIKRIEKLPQQHENFKCYATNQLAIVKMIKYFKDTLD